MAVVLWVAVSVTRIERSPAASRAVSERRRIACDPPVGVVGVVVVVLGAVLVVVVATADVVVGAVVVGVGAFVVPPPVGVVVVALPAAASAARWAWSATPLGAAGVPLKSLMRK